MSEAVWVSPLPCGASTHVRVYRPGVDARKIASDVCERAWCDSGVRVFRWPCGTVAVVAVASASDRALLRECAPMLLATYALQRMFYAPKRRAGPQLWDVIRTLRWAAGQG